MLSNIWTSLWKHRNQSCKWKSSRQQQHHVHIKLTLLKTMMRHVRKKNPILAESRLYQYWTRITSWACRDMDMDKMKVTALDQDRDHQNQLRLQWRTAKNKWACDLGSLVEMQWAADSDPKTGWWWIEALTRLLDLFSSKVIVLQKSKTLLDVQWW